MKKKERYKLFVDYFKKAIPNPKTELKFNSPFELLVAVVLSAQCTDVRVNKTTPHLFNKYPNAKKLSILGTKEKESSKEETQINEDIGEENTDPDSEMLRNKPELKSKSEKIVEKYKKE